LALHPCAVRLALKFGYDGRGFHGFPRQPGQKTVEGDIIEALRGLHILSNTGTPRDIGYGAASRTDAGVSAIGNVIALETGFRPQALLPALNARLEDIWFHSYAEVPDGFRPRDARLRWYRYHLRAEEAGNLPMLRKALRLFEGTHDFSNFSRPEGKDATRTIQQIRLRRSGPFLTVDFFARSFLWNQVRRMMGAALAVSRGDLGLHHLRSALGKPQRKADLGLAPPEGLILMDVDYGLEFIRDRKASDLAARRLEKKRIDAEGTLILSAYLSR
jgi:tRNA pseudouridine38-40 synthase